MQVTDEMVRVAAEAIDSFDLYCVWTHEDDAGQNEYEIRCRGETVTRVTGEFAAHCELASMQAKAALTSALAAMWRPVSELSREENDNRILVAGWQAPNGRTAGYWWWHEDVVFDGAPMDHPGASYWCLAHFALPSPPTQTGG